MSSSKGSTRGRLTSLAHLAVTGTLVAVVAATAATAGPSGAADAAGGPRAEWAHTWAAMPQLTEPHNLPPAPFTQENLVLDDATLRQTVHLTVGGDRIRLRFSNAFGGADLPLTAVSVALPLDGQAGSGAIEEGSSRPVTFAGGASTVVPMGAQVVSDPLDFEVEEGTELTVTAYLADGQASENVTSHPGSRTTSHLLAGNHVDDQDLPGATRTDHWYFLSGVEVEAPRQTAGVAVLGDSLTDGRGSTTNGNNRWPDQLAERLRAHPSTDHVAVLNQAAGGNRVLNDGLGPNVLARLDRDVLALSGVEWLVVFEGVNDIGTAAATADAQERVAADLIAAYQQILVRAHAQGIQVYGATLTPFGDNTMYDDPEGHREAARQTVNEWIRTSGEFDAVIDFDRAVRDPAHPDRLLPTAHDGDWLHLNPSGYALLAEAVPSRFFR